MFYTWIMCSLDLLQSNKILLKKHIIRTKIGCLKNKIAWTSRSFLCLICIRASPWIHWKVEFTLCPRPKLNWRLLSLQPFPIVCNSKNVGHPSICYFNNCNYLNSDARNQTNFVVRRVGILGTSYWYKCWKGKKSI